MYNVLFSGRSSGLAARYDYDPWGRRTKTDGSGEEGDFGFTGHYYHAPSGLHLALYRAYSAELGRWLSRDPIYDLTTPEQRRVINLIWRSLAADSDIYSYVRNNPTTTTDPLGLRPGMYSTCFSMVEFHDLAKCAVGNTSGDTPFQAALAVCYCLCHLNFFAPTQDSSHCATGCAETVAENYNKRCKNCPAS